MNEPKWNDNDRDFLLRTVNYKRSQGQTRIHWKNIGARFTPPRSGDACKRMYNRMIKYPQSNNTPPENIQHTTEIERHIRNHFAESITKNPDIGVHSEVQNALSELQRSYDDLCNNIRNIFNNMKNDVVMDIAKRRLSRM